MPKLISGIFFFTVWFSTYCYSQSENKVLIYANKTDFLLPYIQKTLSEMIDSRTREKIFTQETNLNLLFVNTEADKLLRDNIYYNFPGKEFNATKNRALQDSIFNIFITNNKFLLINENVLLDKIEFQFSLYEILQNESSINNSNNDFPVKNIIKPISQNDFFIDLTSPDYLNTLENGVKKLVIEANFPTQFKTEFSGNINVISKDSFVAAIEDTLDLRILEVYDEDTPPEKVKFKVLILNSQSLLNKPFYIFNKNDINFGITFHSPGLYKLIVVADDGVLVTNGDTVNINVIKTPTLFSLDNKKYLSYVRPLLSSKRVSGKIRYDLSDRFKFFVKNNNDSLEFHIGNKSILKNEDEVIVDSIKKKYISLSKRDRVIFFPNGYNGLKNEFNSLFQKVNRIDSNLYTLDVKGRVKDFDSILYFYGITNGVKTNVEKVRISIVGEWAISLKSGIGFHHLAINQKKCGCDMDSATINFTEWDIFDYTIRYANIKKGALGVSLSVGGALNTSYKNLNEFPIRNINGRITNLTFFYSINGLSKTTFYDMDVHFLIKNIFLGFDSSSQYNKYNQTGLVTYGLGSELKFSPLKFKDFGFFVSGNAYWRKLKTIKVSGVGFSLGLMYNPLFR